MQGNKQTNDPFGWLSFGADIPNNNNNNNNNKPASQYTVNKPAPQNKKSKGPSMNQITAQNNNSYNDDPFNTDNSAFNMNSQSNNPSTINKTNNYSQNNNSYNNDPFDMSTTKTSRAQTQFTDNFDNLWSDNKTNQTNHIAKPTQPQPQPQISNNNPQQTTNNTHSSTTNNDPFMDFDSFFSPNNSVNTPTNTNNNNNNNYNAPSTQQQANQPDFDNLWDDEKTSQQTVPSQPMDLNFLFTEPVTNTNTSKPKSKKTKKKKRKKKEKTKQYDNDIIQQLISLGLGTRQQAIEASLNCINYKDINEVTDELKKIIAQKQSISTSYLNGYENKSILNSCSSGSGLTNGKIMDISYAKSNDIQWAGTYRSSDFDGGNMRKIYDQICGAKKDGSCKIYTKDSDPDDADLLVDINDGELTFFIPRKSNNNDSDDDDDDAYAMMKRYKSEDDMKLDPTYDPFAAVPKDIEKIIKMVKDLDAKREECKINVKDYKKKKYDGVLSYLGFLIGLNMSGMSLNVKAGHNFNIKKEKPFEYFESKWSESDDEMKKTIHTNISLVLLSDEMDEIENKNKQRYGVLLERWNALNNLEKKVFLLKYFLFIGSDLIRISDDDIDIRKMDQDDIEEQNAMLNGMAGGMDAMMAGLITGMAGADSDGEVECKTM